MPQSVGPTIILTAFESAKCRPAPSLFCCCLNGDRMMTRVHVDTGQITTFCRRWKIAELALFGSVLREDFRPDSDVDVLVSFSPEACHTLFDLVRMQDELKQMLGRNVHIVSRSGIEASRNYLRKHEILNSAQVVYGA